MDERERLYLAEWKVSPLSARHHVPWSVREQLDLSPYAVRGARTFVVLDANSKFIAECHDPEVAYAIARNCDFIVQSR